MKFPLPLERDIQRQIIEYLTLAGCFVVRVNSASMKFNDRYVRANSQPGCSDLLVCVPTGGETTMCGEFLALEIKRSRGTNATPSQKMFGAKVARAGGTWACVSSVDEVRKVLRQMGAADVP